MFSQMIRFEWHYFLKQPSFYIISSILFLIAAAITSMDTFGMGGGQTIKNGPYAIAWLITFFNMLSIFLIVNIVGDTAMRDAGSKMTGLLYSKPINPLTYQLGRLTGAISIVLFITAMIPLGVLIGSYMPWVNPERIGPTQLSFYLSSYSYFTLPYLFTFSLIFFALARRFNSLMAVYLCAVAMIVGFEVSSVAMDSPQYRDLAGYIDPFGIQTLDVMTRYWTMLEKNTLAIELSSDLSQSRLGWLAFGVTLFVLLGGLSTGFYKDAKFKKLKKPIKKSNIVVPVDNKIDYKASVNVAWMQFLERCKFEVKQTVFSPSFIILSILFVFALMSVFSEPYMGLTSPLWPITQFMVDEIQMTLKFLIPVVITYYCGEIIWRERQDGFADIVGSMPVNNIVFWASKLIAMSLVVILLVVLSSFIGLAYQNGMDYSNFEIAQYSVRLLFFSVLPWIMMIILAMFLQVISPNKYIGMFLFILYILSDFALNGAGFSSSIYRFAQSPEFTYSDMNGYGRALLSHGWFMLYWGALSAVLAVLGYSLWHRGPQESLKTRFSKMNHMVGATGKRIAIASIALFLVCGGNIYYNTRVLNTYMDTDYEVTRQVAYEKQFVQFEDASFPVITQIKADINIYPQQLKIEASANIEVKNKSEKVIERFLVTIFDFNEQSSLAIEGGQLQAEKGPYNTYWFVFDKPMQPGEVRTGVMTAVRQHQGFIDGEDDYLLIENGTAINSKELFPYMGYIKGIELVDPVLRAENDLPPPRRAYGIDDSSHHHDSSFGKGIDFIDFEATISTSSDQTAIVPGYLQKEWLDGGRRYFHYKMNKPIKNYYTMISARLDVVKEQYKGISVETFLHPEHGVNQQNLQQALKDSFDYFSENFGPYQHQQIRLIEVPRYRNYAQGFANTIPFPEHGLLTDLRDPNTLNTMYDITAHEMAHQWWAHQVDGANVQGAEIISETLAEYSSLLVDANTYGEHKLRRFMKGQLDRYLTGRTREVVEEKPLMYAENQQYIHYFKGSMVMMNLRDKMGEKRINNALKNFVSEFRFKSDPYATTKDLLRHLKHDASASEQQMIDDLFTKITLYDLQLKEMDIKDTDDGQYLITIAIEAQRLEADGQGVETTVSLDEYIDIGLFSADPDDINAEDHVIYFNKHKIISGKNIVKLIVSEKPSFAGVDPYLRLIDRDSEDNMLAL